MISLKLKSDEIGWIKYSLIRTASMLEGRDKTITKKEEKLLSNLLDKIEKQQKRAPK